MGDHLEMPANLFGPGLYHCYLADYDSSIFRDTANTVHSYFAVIHLWYSKISVEMIISNVYPVSQQIRILEPILTGKSTPVVLSRYYKVPNWMLEKAAHQISFLKPRIHLVVFKFKPFILIYFFFKSEKQMNENYCIRSGKRLKLFRRENKRIFANIKSINDWSIINFRFKI